MSRSWCKSVNEPDVTWLKDGREPSTSSSKVRALGFLVSLLVNLILVGFFSFWFFLGNSFRQLLRVDTGVCPLSVARVPYASLYLRTGM